MLDDHLAIAHRSALPSGDSAQLDVIWKIWDDVISRFNVLFDLFLLHAIERADMMRRQLRPASPFERAIRWRRAVIASLDNRQRGIEGCTQSWQCNVYN